jgi:nucleoside-diphosphate-sugar epimerase
VVGSIHASTDWTHVLQGVDVIIHLAARVHVMHDTVADPLAEFRNMNTAASAHLARTAVACGVQRLVYVSSIKVNGEVTVQGEKFSEVSTPAPQDPYGVSKWEAEQALHAIAQETGLQVVVTRPPLVYGAGVKGNFAQMLRVLQRGIPLPFAWVHNQRSLVSVENLADALLLCATHPAAVGQTYLLSDGEDISTPDLLRQLAAAMDVPVRLLPCPPVLLRGLAILVGKGDAMARLLSSLQVDSGKIRRDLNWTPPYTLRQGLASCAAAPNS